MNPGAVAPSAVQKPDRRKPASFALVVHGGAGVTERSAMAVDMERAYRDGITAALTVGRDWPSAAA